MTNEADITGTDGAGQHSRTGHDSGKKQAGGGEQPRRAEQNEQAEQAEQPPQDAAQRRVAAMRGAKRVLSRPHAIVTLGEQLTALAADAGTVYDLDEPVDIYGGGVVAALEERVAGLLGFPAAAFFPTGTMAQQVALRCWAGRTGDPVVALHPMAHPELHERGAFGAVSGLRTVHPTSAPRLPTAAEVRDFEEPFGTLMLELPCATPVSSSRHGTSWWPSPGPPGNVMRWCISTARDSGSAPRTSAASWRRSPGSRTACTSPSTSPSTAFRAPCSRDRLR